MTARNDFEATFGAWLDAEAPRTAPSGLVASVLAVTGESRPLSAWRAMLGTAPMRAPADVLVGSPTLRYARVVVVLIVLALLVGAGGLIAAGAARLFDGDADLPDRSTLTGYRLDLTGGLKIERPDHVFVRGGRVAIAVPPDLVGWLMDHPSLLVLDTGTRQLDGRQATVIDALPVFPPRDVPPETWRSQYSALERHYPYLLPSLFLDGSWQYRFVVVDPGGGGWLVATCEAPREDWTDAVRACDAALDTWKWVEP